MNKTLSLLKKLNYFCRILKEFFKIIFNYLSKCQILPHKHAHQEVAAPLAHYVPQQANVQLETAAGIKLI